MQAFAGFAAAAAVVYAAHRGSSSFDQWLRQKQTERKIAAGERILTIAYKAKDAFPAIRSPLHSAYELAAAEEKLKTHPEYAQKTKEHQGRLQAAQVIFDRMNSHSTVWQETFECLPVARAFYGPQMEEQLLAILRTRRSLEVSAQMYPSHGERSDEFSGKLSRDLWAGLSQADDKPDEIANKIGAAVEYCETHILPVITNDPSKPRTKSSRMLESLRRFVNGEE